MSRNKANRPTQALRTFRARNVCTIDELAALLGKTIKAMIADTPLVKNLNNPPYIDILLDGQATLQQRFAKIDVQTVRRELKIAKEYPEKIPAKTKKIINRPRFPEEFTKILAPPAQTT